MAKNYKVFCFESNHDWHLSFAGNVGFPIHFSPLGFLKLSDCSSFKLQEDFRVTLPQNHYTGLVKLMNFLKKKREIVIGWMFCRLLLLCCGRIAYISGSGVV